MTDPSTATVAAASASYATSIGAGALGWFTATEWVALVGGLLAILTYATNWHYQNRRDRREEERHRAFLESLQRDAPPVDAERLSKRMESDDAIH